ncbi:MAG: hypothetical protein ACXWWN_08215, partial [Gemmatimonadales bacterium]
MGRKRDSGAAGQEGRTSGEKGERRGAQRAPFVAPEIREIGVPGPVPRFEIPGWQERYDVVAGITSRGSEPGRGFDLGLWSNTPVGEVMTRWRAFRRELPEFTAVALGHQVHGVEVMTLEAGRGWVQVEG